MMELKNDLWKFLPVVQVKNSLKTQTRRIGTRMYIRMCIS